MATLLRFGDYQLDLTRSELRVGAELVELKPQTRRLLIYLAMNRARTVPVDELYAEIWGGVRVSESALHQAIRAARRAVGDDGRQQAVIRNEARRGYRFVAAVEELDLAAEPAPGQRYVGRAAQRTAWVEAIESAVAGRGRVLLLSGEAGIGKTRTLSEIEREAQTRDALVVRGAGNPQAGTPLFWPWVQIFRALSAGRPVHGLRRDLEAIVPDMLDPEEVASGGGVEASGEAARFRLFDAALRCLRTASELGPLVVLLDDLHDSGAAAFDLVQLVAREVAEASLLVVVAYRPADALRSPARAEAIARLAAEASVEEIVLDALDDDDARSLIAEQQGRVLVQPLVDALAARARGNPFYLVELTRWLSLESAGDEADVALVAAGVQHLIAARLAALSSAAHLMLRTAAVCGVSVEARTLADATDAQGLDAAVAQGVSLGILVAEAPDRIAFTHALVRDAIYESIPLEDRRRLHLRIGEALLGRRVAEAAFHLAEAAPLGDLERAVTELQRAGDHAGRRFDYEATAVAYHRALRLLEELPASQSNEARRCALLIQAAAADQHTGSVDVARESLVEAMDVARSHQLLEIFARAALAHAYSLDYRGTADVRVIAQLEEALAMLPSGDPALRARLLARLAVELRYLPQQLERASALLDEAEAEATTSGDAGALARVLEDTTVARWSGAAPRAWIEWNQRIVRAARQARDDDLLFRGIKGLATGAMEIGDRAAVDREIGRCRELARESPAPFQRAVATLHATSLHLLEGDFAGAEPGALQVLATGLPDVAGVGMLQLYYLRLELGRIGEIEAAIRSGVHEFPIWQMPIVRMLVELGRFDEARGILRSLPDPKDLAHDRLWLPSLAGLSEAAAALRDEALARKLMRALEPYIEINVVHPHGAIYYGSVAHFSGMLARTLGELDLAERHLGLAAQRHDEMGAHAWSLRTRVERARVAAARGGDRAAKDELADARKQSERYGMASLAREIDAELR